MNLENIDKTYVLNTYAKNYVNFVKGKNARLWDDKEIEYIDFTSGIAVVSVGHGNKRVADVICKQVNNITHISNLYAIEPQALLAKKIAKLSNYDVKTFFGNSGAEANEAAIKIARKYGQTKFKNKKYKVLTLEYSFHGRTITTVKACGQEKMHTDNFSPYPDGFKYCSSLNNIIKNIDEETVAVMIELVQGEGGVHAFDIKEIQNFAKTIKEKEVLLIVDEVQTGAYRTGEFLCSQVYGITPDIITMAKGLGGGVPIGAVLTIHKDIFVPGDHGSTYGGNYLSTAASLEVLSILEEEKASGQLDLISIYFKEKLDEMLSKYSNIFTEVVGLGLIRGIRVKNDEILGSLITLCFNEGLLLLKAGKTTLRFLPALTITKEDIDEGFKRLENAIRKI